MAFKFPYMCDYVIKLCNTLAEVIQNHLNPNVRRIVQEDARNRKNKRPQPGSDEAYNRSADLTALSE
jgi:hypothetical protein